LRLEGGSTEAGFLAAFANISSIPTFVVIENGQLQIQLNSDVTKNEFINSIRQVLGANPIPGSSAAPVSPPQASTPEPAESRALGEAEDDLYGPSEPYEHTIPASSAPAAVSTPSATAKGKQKATSTSESHASSSASTNAAQKEARDALRKKKKEDAEELARVKARIVADKIARKAEAEQRKAEREKERKNEAQSDIQPRTTTSTRGSQAKSVNLNIRLFDGRTIRSAFPRTATLQKEVRSWIDTEFSKLAQDDPNINHKELPPYFFRHIIAPQPSREISAGDESQSLGDIDLAPSATLVLFPVKGYTDAYAGAGGGVVGTATGVVGGALGLLSSTVGYIGNTLGSVVGYGSAPTQSPAGRSTESQPSHASQQAQPPDGSNMRVRTLADQRAREPQQFYNGNQVSRIHTLVSNE
jgi:hypothetical protein